MGDARSIQFRDFAIELGEPTPDLLVREAIESRENRMFGKRGLGERLEVDEVEGRGQLVRRHVSFFERGYQVGHSAPGKIVFEAGVLGPGLQLLRLSKRVAAPCRNTVERG